MFDSTMLFVSAQLIRNPLRYFQEPLYKYRALSDDVQKLSTVTPPTFFIGLCPFVKFRHEFVSAQ